MERTLVRIALCLFDPHGVAAEGCFFIDTGTLRHPWYAMLCYARDGTGKAVTTRPRLPPLVSLVFVFYFFLQIDGLDGTLSLDRETCANYGWKMRFCTSIRWVRCVCVQWCSGAGDTAVMTPGVKSISLKIFPLYASRRNSSEIL